MKPEEIKKYIKKCKTWSSNKNADGQIIKICFDDWEDVCEKNEWMHIAISGTTPDDLVMYKNGKLVRKKPLLIWGWRSFWDALKEAFFPVYHAPKPAHFKRPMTQKQVQAFYKWNKRTNYPKSFQILKW